MLTLRMPFLLVLTIIKGGHLLIYVICYLLTELHYLFILIIPVYYFKLDFIINSLSFQQVSFLIIICNTLLLGTCFIISAFCITCNLSRFRLDLGFWFLYIV